MDINLTLWNIVILLGSLQGLFLVLFLLLNKKGSPRANRILALIISIVAFDSFTMFLQRSNYIVRLPHLILASEAFYVLLGPLLLLYTLYLSDPGFRLKKVHLFALLPFLLEFALFIPYYLQPGDWKLETYRQLNTSWTSITEYSLIWAAELAYNFLFIIKALRVIRQHRRKIKESFSDVSKINLHWLRNCMIGSLAVLSMQLSMIIVFLARTGPFDTMINLYYLILALLFYVIGYQGLMQPEIFSSAGRADTSRQREQMKYRRSSLQEETAREGLTRLSALMDREKPYLENDIKLQELAERLSLSTNHLSQIINGKTGRNFYDYINSYRVEEAKRLLKNPDYKDLTMIAVAMDAGFSSKSSFNKVFKDFTGQTPSQYKKAPETVPNL